MAKEINLHKIKDWSKIDEEAGFWGKIDLLRPNDNFGIHRYQNDLWTSGQVGIGRIFDKNHRAIHDNGKEHILLIESSYGLDPWEMLETVMLDDEYEMYVKELEDDDRFLFKVFYDQPLIKLPLDVNVEADILFALSYISSCYSLCKNGLKKSLVKSEQNFTGKVRGKINVNKNIKHNTIRGRCDKFYCNYLDFTEDTKENRIIKVALLKSQEIIKNRFREDYRIKDKIRFCLGSLKNVKLTKVKNNDFQTISVGGLYSYYEPVIRQAKAIISLRLSSYLNKKGRAMYVVPYSINMETLFEYYARIKLKQKLKDGSYKIEKYSKKYFLQNYFSEQTMEKNIHLVPFCIPDIVVYENKEPLIVMDVKYKPVGRSNRADSHQLLAYVLLTGAKKCGFILPGNDTFLREMKTTGKKFLNLSPPKLRYYELILGTNTCSDDIRRLLD